MATLDTHTHVWAHGTMHPFQVTAGPLRATPSALAETARSAGVEGALIIPSSADLENQHALAASRSLGPNFGAVALLREVPSANALPDLVQGFVGLRLNLQDPLTHDRLEAGLFDVALAAADEARMALSLQLRPEMADSVLCLAETFPRLPIILDHLGSPSGPADPGLDSLRRTASAPNVLLKLSGQHAWSRAPYPYEDTWAWCLTLVEAFTPRRTLWGSNWPLSGEASPYRQVAALPDVMLRLGAVESALVMGGNARQVYPRLVEAS